MCGAESDVFRKQTDLAGGPTQGTLKYAVVGVPARNAFKHQELAKWDAAVVQRRPPLIPLQQRRHAVRTGSCSCSLPAGARVPARKCVKLSRAHPVDAAVVQWRPPLGALQQLPCAVHARSCSRSWLAGGALQACAAGEPAGTARQSHE